MPQRYTLYNYWRSSASYRVRIALHWKQLPFEYVAVHLMKDGGEQNRPEYRAINPMTQVPTLAWDDDAGARQHLTQSLAIIEYLDERYPERPLLPEGALARAHVRQLAEVINSGIQPMQNLPVIAALNQAGGNGIKFATDANIKGLHALEALVARYAGAFCVGDAVSLADICLAPQLVAARRFAVPLEPYPTLTRVDAALAALPAFAAAHPDRQPDANT